MSYKVRYKGTVEIECDNPQEAISIAKALADANGGVTDNPLPDIISPDAGVRLTSSRYQEFISYLDGEQKKCVAALVDSPHGRTDQNLRQILGLSDNNQLGGVLSGLSKNAKKAGLSIGDILNSQWVKIGNDRVKEFKAEPGFANLARASGGLK